MAIDLDSMNLDQLKAHRREVDKRIENYLEVKKREIIRAAQEAARELNLSLSDVFGSSMGSSESSQSKVKKPVAPKYRDPASGATWSGRGRCPAWLADAEKAGRKREDFLI